MTKLIPLTHGKHAIVDDEDYEWLMQWKWQFSNHHVVRYESRKLHGGKQKRRPMQHDVLKIPSSVLIDHIDGDGLNNCRSNLRICTPQQNSWNSRKAKGNHSSQYKGVYLHKSSGLYWAYIHVNGKRISLGYHKDEISAAQARNMGARKYHGEFAKLNDISTETT